MARSIDDADLRALKDAFKMFDKDGSGSISASELKVVLRELNIHVTDKEVRMILREMDLNGDGEIQLDEFLKVMAKEYYRKFSTAELKSAFRYFDRDGDGFIDAKELGIVFERLGKSSSKDEIARMIQAADLDGNGYISFDEFEKILNS